MRSRFYLAGLSALLGSVVSCGCSRPVGPATEKTDAKQSPSPATTATTAVTWPAVSMVLDGTDLVEIDKVAPEPFAPLGVAGAYRSEQGGSVLSLVVKNEESEIRIARRYQEPGTSAIVKPYELFPVAHEGFASAAQDVFLKKTKAGVMVLEKNSGVDSIPASYWVLYIRQ